MDNLTEEETQKYVTPEYYDVKIIETQNLDVKPAEFTSGSSFRSKFKSEEKTIHKHREYPKQFVLVLTPKKGMITVFDKLDYKEIYLPKLHSVIPIRSSENRFDPDYSEFHYYDKNYYHREWASLFSSGERWGGSLDFRGDKLLELASEIGAEGTGFTKQEVAEALVENSLRRIR